MYSACDLIFLSLKGYSILQENTNEIQVSSYASKLTTWRKPRIASTSSGPV